MNTPMMSSLCKLSEVNNREIKEVYVKSVLQRNITTYWLGYLYKKIHQQEKEHLIKCENQGVLEQNTQNIKYFLPKRLIKLAQ